MRLNLKRLLTVRPYLGYLLVSLAVLLPLLGPGYVLTLDMVFAPTIPVPPTSAQSFPFYGVLWLLNTVFPTDLLQKLMLAAIIVLSGWGIHRLVARAKPADSTVNWSAVCYSAGLLYICNPFTYSRFMAGQFAVLLGYALLPFFMQAVLHFLARPVIKTATHAVVWLTAISIVSVHSLGLALLAATGLLAGQLLADRPGRAWLLSAVRAAAVGGVIFALLNSYWIVPTLLGNGAAANLAESFGSADRTAFATAGDGWYKLLNILTLQGFWADGKNLYTTARELYWWWWLPHGALLALVAIGISYGWRKVRSLTIGLLAAMAPAIVLAAGTQGTIFGSLNQLLTNVLPLFAGYREPQKFVALLALSYAVFAALGVAYIWQRGLQAGRTIKTHDVIAGTITLAVLLSPLMLWGFHGQLSAVAYPADWYQIERRLAQDPQARVLSLPWHQYMRFDFAGRIIANPADRFFSPQVIMSSNPELKGLTHWPRTPEQAKVEDEILPAARLGYGRLGRDLDELNIQYVLLAKEHDFGRYTYLDNQQDLRLIADTQHLRLYKVTAKKE